eukprot:6459138-Pyramimonas_sp.AAC.1
MRPALQREHDVEGLDCGSETRTENGNKAGVRFGAKPALQRKGELEGPSTPVLLREHDLEQLE